MEVPRLQLDCTSSNVPRQQDEPVFVVRDLLWKDICALLKPAEVDEIKRVLGMTRIDDNEVSYMIWKDYFGEVDLMADSRPCIKNYSPLLRY